MRFTAVTLTQDDKLGGVGITAQPQIEQCISRAVFAGMVPSADQQIRAM